MNVRLIVFRGKLRDNEGHDRGLEVMITCPRFTIGSAPDCSMCCRSSSVSPHHCEILVDGLNARIRSMCVEPGTFVNDQRVEVQQLLRDGDLLRIGRLEFRIAIQATAMDPNPPKEPSGELGDVGQGMNNRQTKSLLSARRFLAVSFWVLGGGGLALLALFALVVLLALGSVGRGGGPGWGGFSAAGGVGRAVEFLAVVSVILGPICVGLLLLGWRAWHDRP